jgi:hypothetical protein
MAYDHNILSWKLRNLTLYLLPISCASNRARPIKIFNKKIAMKTNIIFFSILSFFSVSVIFGMQRGAAAPDTLFALTQQDRQSISRLRGAIESIAQQPISRASHAVIQTRSLTEVSGAAAKDTLLAHVRESSEQIGYLQRRLDPKPDNALVQHVESRALNAIMHTLIACREKLENLEEDLMQVPSYTADAQAQARSAGIQVRDALAEFFSICAEKEVPRDSLRALAREEKRKRDTLTTCPAPQEYLRKAALGEQEFVHKYVSADSVLLLCADLMQHYTASIKKAMVPCSKGCASHAFALWCAACKAAKRTAEREYEEAVVSSCDPLCEMFQPSDPLEYLNIRIGAAATAIDHAVEMRLWPELASAESLDDADGAGAGSADGRRDEDSPAAAAAAGPSEQAQATEQPPVSHETLVSTMALCRQLLASKAEWAEFLHALSDDLTKTLDGLLAAPPGRGMALAEASVSTENAGGWFYPLAWAFNRLAVGEQKKTIEEACAKLPKDLALTTVVNFVHHPLLEPLLRNGKHKPLFDLIRHLGDCADARKETFTQISDLLALSNRKRTLGLSSGYMHELGNAWWPQASVVRPLVSADQGRAGAGILVPVSDSRAQIRLRAQTTSVLQGLQGRLAEYSRHNQEQPALIVALGVPGGMMDSRGRGLSGIEIPGLAGAGTGAPRPGTQRMALTEGADAAGTTPRSPADQEETSGAESDTESQA